MLAWQFPKRKWERRKIHGEGQEVWGGGSNLASFWLRAATLHCEAEKRTLRQTETVTLSPHPEWSRWGAPKRRALPPNQTEDGAVQRRRHSVQKRTPAKTVAPTASSHYTPCDREIRIFSLPSNSCLYRILRGNIHFLFDFNLGDTLYILSLSWQKPHLPNMVDRIFFHKLKHKAKDEAVHFDNIFSRHQVAVQNKMAAPQIGQKRVDYSVSFLFHKFTESEDCVQNSVGDIQHIAKNLVFCLTALNKWAKCFAN